MRPYDQRGDDTSPTADEETPWVNVYELSQTVFCPRAGLITHELGQADEGEDPERGRSPRLDWLPDYDEVEIQIALEQKWHEVGLVCRCGLFWLVICTAVYFLYDWKLGLALGLPALAFVPWFWVQVGNIAELGRRLRAAAAATGAVIISDLGQQECVVNWWDLRRAGFSVEKPADAVVHREWKLAGKPYLTLKYASLHIPVVRKHRGKHEVHAHNRARVAAYCHLIEKEEQAQAPFGVFMFAGSYDVWIIPNSPANRALFQNGLRRARNLFLDAAAGELPGPPTGNQCIRCPLGKPLVFKRGQTDAHLAVLRGAYTPRRGADNRDYHSLCGDRFEWRPAHEKAKEKGLER